MLEIIKKFRPLINKKYREAYYDEDIKSELTLKLIRIIKDIRIDNMREINEFVLLRYIEKSIHNHYIHVLKKNRANKTTEIFGEFEEAFSFSKSGVSDAIFFQFLQAILTNREFECVYYNVFMGYTAEEIAEYLHISKQACNQNKLRAFKKIRKYY